MGNPNSYNSRQIGVSVSAEVAQRILSIAKEEGISLSRATKHLVLAGLEAEGLVSQ